ncbi:MAG: glycogen debranching enzyme family protein [Proteobacteria bacterium]|nr:glycogen debranching enzyme family protein [Pseudomonadota bacterium]
MTLPRSCIAQEPDALAREWLVTNGIGGFACGTISQANTRRYHSWLTASLRPPVDRVVMLAKADVTVTLGERRYQLSCNEFTDGTIAPQGFQFLANFRVVDGIPTWRYVIEGAVLEQRLWMAEGRNTTYVSFRLLVAGTAIGLDLNPLCTYRDYHSHAQGGWSLDVRAEAGGCAVAAFSGARPYRLLLDRGEFRLQPEWYWRFKHRAEGQRGLDDSEDLLSVGTFLCALKQGETATLIATSEAGEPLAAEAALRSHSTRTESVLKTVPARAPSWIRRLTLAADQFIVNRAPAGKTVIAGYPWFSDWGRDTMIALPGLTIPTGRLEDAAEILRTFARHADQGMLPNRFPDSGEAPEYNTVDAALWFFHAVSTYLDATPNRSLLGEIYRTLKQIVDWHERGTRHGIRVDPTDGLLRAGATGVQLTWMDAKIGDWVVTPRIGKAVEINALWHFGLMKMAEWANELNDSSGAAHFGSAADRVKQAFQAAFWFEEGGYLYDVIGGPDAPGKDTALRPNQIFAVSLGTGLLDPSHERAVVEVCARELLTPVGLRSLASSDSRYARSYVGGAGQRDAVYHQGTVWSWLLGPFALAHHRVFRNAPQALSLLEGLALHLDDACLGTVSEIFDGDAPHAPRGCFAQAWSVAETLRAWHYLSEQS